MKLAVAIGTLAVIAASPALAANGCATVPKSQWQPTSKLETLLKGEGYTVRQIKTENGCYEVYATNGGGQRVNEAFNAETLKKVSSAEAGEN
jgi:hypothetical protein